ncbi:MAG: CRISPR-associated endoribonuclease Cas6 [Euryarchaeota archaeon]|nr:CRISPR-associated endoribonuclease Cas6 [Euryarchaeota archaeon]
MRVKVHLRGSGILPFNYHYQLSAAMYHYKKLADAELSARLHYSTDIKTFTFSEIMVPKRRIRTREPKGIEILDDYSYIIYSSPVKEYIEAVVTGMLSEPALRIGRLKFTIARIEVLETPDVDWKDVHFRTLSPVVVSTRNSEDKKVPVYPTEPQWYVNVEKNIKHQYEEVHGEVPDGRLNIEVMHFKTKGYEFKKNKDGKIEEGYIKAVHGHFRFRGVPELIKFAYEAGVGERGAQGFGCLALVNDK